MAMNKGQTKLLKDRVKELRRRRSNVRASIAAARLRADEDIKALKPIEEAFTAEIAELKEGINVDG